MPNANFFNSKCEGTSQFWKGLHKVKHLFKWGTIHKVGDGTLTSSWSDVWLDQSPLKLQFPNLFRICEDSTAMVAYCCANNGWPINFRRNLSLRENASWEELLSLL